MTLDYLRNNTSEALELKVMENYNEFPLEQQGGPLFFKLMMDVLQEASDTLADNIVDRIKKLKISDQQGEDVSVIVNLTCSAIKQLENLHDHHGNSLMPIDFGNTLLKIFQTSSVPAFNKHFEDILEENLHA